MSSIQNYLNKAQEFSSQVSQEEQLEQSKTAIRQKAESNIEDVRDRVEELKAGISGDVGAFGFGTAGAVEKAFTYGRYVSDKASKLRAGVNSLRSGLDQTEFGKIVNEKISSLVSPDSALGRHLQTVGEQVNKLKVLTEKNPLAKTQEIMTDVKNRFDNLTPKGQSEFVKAIKDKDLPDTDKTSLDPTDRLSSAIQHDELLKQVEGVPDNIKKGLPGGAGPGAPLSSTEATQGDITQGQATTQTDFTKPSTQELGTGGKRKVRFRTPEDDSGGGGGGAAAPRPPPATAAPKPAAAAPAADDPLIKATDPKSILKPGESVLADVSGGGAAADDDSLIQAAAPVAPKPAAAPVDTRPPPARAAATPAAPADPIVNDPSVSGAPSSAPVATPTGTPTGTQQSQNFTQGQQTQVDQNLKQSQVAQQRQNVAQKQEDKVEDDKGGDKPLGDEEKALGDEADAGAGEGILGALGPVGDVLAAGSAIYGLVHAEIAKKAEQKTQVDLQSYYDSLNEIKAPNLGSLGANVLDGTQIQSSFTNF